ncbi:MAG: Signal transduction histidine-protein kinase AtoS [Bacteroidota bacterium]|jgi:sigma-B regulation protein RsbU (phosphoserine phosphatase)
MKIGSRRPFWFLTLIASLLLSISCQKDENTILEADKSVVEAKLDVFVASLAQEFPADLEALKSSIQNYLTNAPDYFYGATVALLDAQGVVVVSPYFYRTSENALQYSEGLMGLDYQINSQDWIRLPIDSGEAVWTDPYFDAGGGNIWMQTRAVPVYVRNGIIAIATTDVQVSQPK